MSIKEITTFANPNMSDEEIKFGLVIQKAILTGQCNECKYLTECENNPFFEFPKDSWCIRNYRKVENDE